MKFGMPCWPGDLDILKRIKVARELGFDYIEVYLDYPWPEQLVKQANSILLALEKSSLDIAFHAPTSGIQIANPRALLRESSVSFLLGLIDFCSKFSPLHMDFHVDADYCVEDFGWPELKKEAISLAKESARQLIKKGHTVGVPVAFENLQTEVFGHIDYFRELLTVKDARLCLDAGHATISNRTVGSASISVWLEEFSDRILASHISDLIMRKGVLQDEFVLGHGTFNVEPYLKALSKTNCNYVVLETFLNSRGKKATDSELKQSLNLCRDALSVV